jgi:plasmid virulence protein D
MSLLSIADSLIGPDLYSSVAIGIGTTALGLATKAALNVLTDDSAKYKSELPADIKGRVACEDFKDAKSERIIKALKSKKDPEEITYQSLTKEKLAQIANDVNGSYLHYTGNCVLLARTMLYNLTNETNILSANNTPPFYSPLSRISSEKILFGKELVSLSGHFSTDELESAVLEVYKRYKQAFCVITSIGYRLPIVGKTSEHDFNAVVLFDKEANKPYVQFVDAWKTSNYTPSKEELKQRYPNGRFGIHFLMDNQ